jgi:hypothetical protein
MMSSGGLYPPTEPASWTATRRVVISGSMTFYGEMVKVARCLDSSAVKVITPDAEDHLPSQITLEQFEEFKREAAFAHLRRIRDPRTFGVLALNFDKYDIPDYIGPSTFAEIAVAAASGKRIYLIGDYPSVYAEELAYWGAVRLYGHFDELLRDYGRECLRPSPQLRLFG